MTLFQDDLPALLRNLRTWRNYLREVNKEKRRVDPALRNSQARRLLMEARHAASMCLMLKEEIKDMNCRKMTYHRRPLPVPSDQ